MIDQIRQKADVSEDSDTLLVKIRQTLTDEESLYLHELAKKKNLGLEMSKANLTEEEKASLERMREFQKRMESVPESQRFPISNPDKYNFPIGIDDNGNFFSDSLESPKRK